MAASRRLTAVLATSALVAACGSTVPAQQRGAGGSGSGVESPGHLALVAGPDATTPEGAAQSTGSNTAAGRAAARQAAGSAAGTAASRTQGGPVGPGITATEIRLGAEYTSDADAGAAAVGAAGTAAGDLRQLYNAVIGHINKQGGVAKRKLVPIYYGIQSQSSQTIDQQDQAACTHFIHDNKVFLISGGRPVLNACAEKAGGVAIAYGNETAETFKTYPHYVDPISFRLDRLGPIMVNGLSRERYFGGKLGLVTWDDPNYVYAMERGYLPALAGQTIKPTAVQYITTPQSIGDLGASNAAVSNAVLKFRSEGIDHVIVQDGPAGVYAGTGLTLQWMNAAESQAYRPRYGMNSYNSPGSPVIPPAQERDAVAVSWANATASSDEGWRTNETREQCFTIMRDAGVNLEAGASTKSVAAIICDALFAFRDAMNRAPSLTADGFIAGVESLGSFPTASVYGARLGPNKHDGGELVRTARFVDACACFQYTSTPFRAD
jgi:hypothetical protein